MGGLGWEGHIRSPCPALPKEPLVLPALPVQRDYRNVSELQVSFLFLQRKQAGILISPQLALSHAHCSALELTEACSNGQALPSLLQLAHQACAGEAHPRTPLSPTANKRGAPRETFGGSRDQL